MTRTLLILTMLGTLASCAEYREPQANCFAFRAAISPADEDCVFIPLGAPESDIAV